jgi:hypothetical protein
MCCIYFLAPATVVTSSYATEQAVSATGEKQHQNQEEEQQAAVNASYIISHMEYLLIYLK